MRSNRCTQPFFNLHLLFFLKNDALFNFIHVKNNCGVKKPIAWCMMRVHHEMGEKEKLYFINCIALAFFLQDPEASALASRTFLFPSRFNCQPWSTDHTATVIRLNGRRFALKVLIREFPFTNGNPFSDYYWLRSGTLTLTLPFHILELVWIGRVALLGALGSETYF